jgi:hypothetical protein
MTAREQVKMNMINRLAGAGVIVADDPESFFRFLPFPRYPGGHLIDMADEGIVRRIKIQGIDEMLSGDDKKMCRRNRRNVFNSNDLFIPVDYSCGDLLPDYPAEDTAIHYPLPAFNA